MKIERKAVFTSFLLILTLLPALFIRLRLLDFPLERDEGEYAYAGQLLLQGIAPYVQAYNMKWPGIYAAYALIMAVFGQSVAGVHLGVILVSFTTALLLFVITRRIAGNAAGIVAAGTYSLLSISTGTLGLAGHATHFVMLPALGGIALLMESEERLSAWKIFAAGVLLGTAPLMKQHGVVFGLFCAAWLTGREYGRISNKVLAQHLGLLGLGGIIPLFLTIFLLATAGVLGKFWLWTFTYARAYTGIVTLPQGWENFQFAVKMLTATSPGLWCLALCGAAMLFLVPSLRPWRRFVTAFTLVSLLAVCPGLYFRRHYFIILLPAIGILAGFTAAGIFKLQHVFSRPAFMTGLLFSLAAGISLWTERDIFFRLSPDRACREVYGPNPFPESLNIARYIEEHSPSDARIAVFGSEPQISFYSRRHSATGYIYMYPLMEKQPLAAMMQQEMIQEIETAKPRYIVLVSVPTSWLRSADSQPILFNWMDGYLAKIRLAGFVEILQDGTYYSWNLPPAATLTTLIKNRKSDYWIAVLENQALP